MATVSYDYKQSAMLCMYNNTHLKNKGKVRLCSVHNVWVGHRTQDAGRPLWATYHELLWWDHRFTSRLMVKYLQFTLLQTQILMLPTWLASSTETNTRSKSKWQKNMCKPEDKKFSRINACQQYQNYWASITVQQTNTE